MTTWRVSPLTDLTWLRLPAQRRRSPFSATWAVTDQLLMREIDKLQARDVDLQMDVTPGQIRKSDGWIRADATPGSPAVRLLLETRRGSLAFQTDAFTHWKDNLRGIALSLENLRAVERYGVLSGQQYVGSLRAIEAGSGTPASHMTESDARAVLTHWSGLPWNDHPREIHLRRAKAATHPDRHNGDRAAWDTVEQAAAVLGLLP